MQIKVPHYVLITGLIFIAACGKNPITPEPNPPTPEPVMGSHNIENPVVRIYLNKLELSPYRDGDYSYSYVDNYYSMTTPYRKDQPYPANVTWTRDEASIIQKVTVSEDSLFSSSRTLSIKNSISSYGIYNLEPGKKYFWKTTAQYRSKEQKEIATSSFQTTGRRRFLKIDGVCNVRDLGGIATADGSKRIKYGLLFRGGEMNGHHKDYDGNWCRISDAGIDEMRWVGIRAVLDMRTAEEAEYITSSPLGEDVSYVRFENANTYYYDKFWENRVYLDALQWIIDELRAGRPVYFNCIYGADRTGTLAFIVEALLGVSENDLSVDYELTSFSYGLENAPRRRGPKNAVTVIKYRQMVEHILTSTDFSGNTLQEKIRNFCLSGNYGSVSKKISSSDLDWFTSYVLEDI